MKTQLLSSNMFKNKIKGFSFVLFFALSLFVCEVYAQQVNFGIKYQDTFNGDIVYLANNSVGQNATSSYSGTLGNDGVQMVHVDIDNDNTTFNSSSSTLSLDTCSEIAFAGLYWSAMYPFEEGVSGGGASSTGGARLNPNTVKLKLPGGSYQTITGTKIYDDYYDGSQYYTKPYAYYKDITGLLQGLSNPSGTYTVADVRATKGYIIEKTSTGGTINSGCAGGWTIVIVYKNSSKTSKHFTVYDGFAGINGTIAPSSLEFGYAGFQTVPNGQVKGSYGIATLDGDKYITGDYLEIKNTSGNFIALTDNVNPADNFFNSSISNNGSNVTTRNPASTNTLGFDVDLLTIDSSNNNNNSLISNGQTSATFRARTNTGDGNKDAYYMFLSSFAIEVYEPDIVIAKTMQNSSGNLIPQGATVQPLDILTYKFTIRNKGNDAAKNLIIEDLLPFNADYVVNSIAAKYTTGNVTIPIGTSAPNTTTPIQYSYNAGTNKLTFNVDDSLIEADDDEFYIVFNVKITDNPFLLRSTCGQQVKNQATISYVGTINTIIDINNAPSASYISACGISDESPTASIVNISGVTYPTDPIVVKNACDVLKITKADIQAAASTGFDITKYKIYNSNTLPPTGTEITEITASGTYYAIGLLDSRFGDCYDISTISATINQKATVTAITNKTYCDSSTVPITTLSGPVAGTTYTWTNSDTSIGLAASGTGNVPTFTATNTTTAPITSTITITPTANGCIGTPLSYYCYSLSKTISNIREHYNNL